MFEVVSCVDDLTSDNSLTGDDIFNEYCSSEREMVPFSIDDDIDSDTDSCRDFEDD